MIENTILKKNREGLKALVFGLTFPSAELVELAAVAGFDAINLDGEHGAFSPEAIDLICRVANGYGLSVTARVPNLTANRINRFLDRGGQGITGPHVETREQAQALADACLFPPDGWRSWGGGRGTEFNDAVALQARYGGQLAFARWANANMIVGAQIESRLGWENLDAILSVPGLTAVTGGPNDFAASLGHPGEPNHPERVAATADIERRARAAGKQVAGDLAATLGIHELMLTTARDFVARHKDDRVGK
jgi:2-keto-3-deoxy-L-rhamnonate aldolase RhmA